MPARPVYYLPIWFQAIKGASAISSGIHLLPMIIPIVMASIMTGQLVSRIGYYTPFMIFGVCFAAIGSGLLTILKTNTTAGLWIGFQILYGFGLGSCSQAPNLAAQTVLKREDVSVGASLMFFGQTLFGAVFVSVGQNVLDNQLANRLAGITGITPQLIQSTGATELLSFIPAKYHAEALKAYNNSLRVCFQVALIMACLSTLGAASMEWRTVRKNLPPKKPDTEREDEEANAKEESTEKEAPEAGAQAETATSTVSQSVGPHTSTSAIVDDAAENTKEKTETEKEEANRTAM